MEGIASSAWATARHEPRTLSELGTAFADVFAERTSMAQSVREHHSEDEAYHVALPDIVVFPTTTADVAKAAEICARFQCPLVAWGAGTSLEANALATSGGVCLDLSGLNRVLEVHAEDLTATVQAGVLRSHLNAELKNTGLFFPIDPGADATLGGMAATRASGTTTVKYGTMRDNVVSCTAVLADGRVIRSGTRAPKSAAGYDVTGLLVGSEGTLGIITELTVRLHPLPEQVAAMVCVFESLEAAVQAVILAIQSGLGVARLELLDDHMMAAINRFEKATYPVAATLFVEFHGSKAVIEDQVQQFADITESSGGRMTQRAMAPDERAVLWKARHNALYASRALKPNGRVLITDACVPISRLADCILATRADLDRSGLTATIAGHVGDGNFHAFICVDHSNPHEVAEAEALHARMAERAIQMDGTCTGEHGIGVGKRALLVTERGEAVEVMRAIKSALDPNNLLNPGKIFV